MKGMTSVDSKFHRRNMDFSSYNKSCKPPEVLKSSHGRFDIYSEVKSNQSETPKRTIPRAPNTDDSTPTQNESDHYISVGGTLSDGIKSLKMIPVLN